MTSVNIPSQTSLLFLDMRIIKNTTFMYNFDRIVDSDHYKGVTAYHGLKFKLYNVSCEFTF